ncbi:hypothetical protein KC336_g21747, partial [Hortaea werneckii]
FRPAPQQHGINRPGVGCAAPVMSIAKMAGNALASLIGAVGRALYRQDAANTPG